jgi:hypothetical protein
MPVIDAHNHLNANIAAEALLQPMDRAGVESMVLMPRHYTAASDGGLASDEQALDYSKRYPGRFIPFIGGQRDDLGPRAINNPVNVSSVLREFSRKLNQSEFRGLGEFILRHHSYDVGGGDAALAAKQRVPVLFHAEAEEQPAREAEALIAAFPDTLFIWAHSCGPTDLGRVRQGMAQEDRVGASSAGRRRPRIAGDEGAPGHVSGSLYDRHRYRPHGSAEVLRVQDCDFPRHARSACAGNRTKDRGGERSSRVHEISGARISDPSLENA